MKKITTLIFIVFATYQSNAQELNKDNRLQFSVFSGVARATFASNPSAPSKFPALELRLGAGIIKPVSKSIEIRTRLTFGTKFKRDAFNKPGQPYLIGPPYLGLDELASNRNHYFVEIPVVVQFNLPHPKIGFSLGVNYRFFLPHNSSVDDLTNRRELGLISGITYRLNKKIDMGLDYCAGLTKIYSPSGSIDSQSFSANARNQFAQLRIDYRIKRQN